MKQELDKLIYSVKRNKKMLTFLLGLMTTGILAGSVFVILLKKTDQKLIMDYLNTYLSNIQNHEFSNFSLFLSTFFSNTIFVILIWLLGISILGLPIILFLFFSKSFVFGFSITSMILTKKAKGILYSVLGLFPHQFFSLLILILLLTYAITVSLKLLKSLLKKETFDFKKIRKIYSKILLVSFMGVLCSSLLEIYVSPFLLEWILTILK